MTRNEFIAEAALKLVGKKDSDGLPLTAFQVARKAVLQANILEEEKCAPWLDFESSPRV